MTHKNTFEHHNTDTLNAQQHSWSLPPFDQLVNSQVASILDAHSKLDILKKKGEELVLAWTKNKHDFENWLIEEAEYQANLTAIIQNMELLEAQYDFV
jgi:hypothetical protein